MLLRSLPLRSSLPPQITPPPPPSSQISSYRSSSCSKKAISSSLTRRQALALSSSLLQISSADAGDSSNGDDTTLQDEERVVQIFEPKSAASAKLPLAATTAASPVIEEEEEEELRGAKVEGTGSGFVWDNSGHIVTNYHVIAKLATDNSGLQRCKVFLKDGSGNAYAKEGKLIRCDPSYDLAVLKVDVEGDKLRPALIGSSGDLRVGQSCFAIGSKRIG